MVQHILGALANLGGGLSWNGARHWIVIGRNVRRRTARRSLGRVTMVWLDRRVPG